jgi:hypothetical protein
MDTNRVAAFRQHYLRKSAKNPDLYRSGPRAVDVILPNDLLEYANAASGHSGFGAGARARGIRRECRDSAEFLREIFSSDQRLTEFLLSSEQNAEAYINEVRQRPKGEPKPRAKKVTIAGRDPQTTPAQGNLYDFFARDQIVAIAKSLGGAAEFQAQIQGITITEFSDRFGVSL